MIKKLIMCVIALSAALSCSKSEEGDLSVDMIGDSTYLSPSEQYSCANRYDLIKNPNQTTPPSKDVSASTFQFHGLTLNWKNTTDTAVIMKIDIEFTNSNFVYSCSLDGDELNALFATGDTAPLPWDSTLAPATSLAPITSRTSWSQCHLLCGNASPVDPKKGFTASGTVTIRGFQRGPAPDYDEKPIKAKASVKVVYQP